MVIIKVKDNHPMTGDRYLKLIEVLQMQAKNGVVILPPICEILYADSEPAGKVYTIRKNGVICDTSDRPKCGYTEKELEQLREAGFDLYIGETKAERGHCLGPVCLRWNECGGTQAETCPL